MNGSIARLLLSATLITSSLACSAESQSAAETARDIAALSAQGSSAGDACSRFSTQEIARHVGAPVQVMGATTGGGCAWEGTNDEDVYASVLVSSEVNYWERPHGAPGFEELPGMGRSAYVVPELGGWRAGVLTDSRFAVVTMSGGQSSRTRAIAMLNDLMQRIR
jgi:hypothetical protein